MDLTIDHVTALAPDAGSAIAGKKLAAPPLWQGLGQNSHALWGECQGSAQYQVCVDRDDLATRCSCPSRKFPCKHGLGLLLLAATAPAALPAGNPPLWVEDWLAKRGAGRRRKEERRAEQAPAPPKEADSLAQATRAGRRQARILAGLDVLDLWMNDLVRAGLGALETQPVGIWEAQAARLVDAQAPGLARRLRQMAAIPNSGPAWPERLLDHLGRLALLVQAYRRLASLPPALQDDLRAAVGWTLESGEVAARGERVTDEWAFVGQRISEDDRVRTQWTWLVGTHTGRSALVLQFSAGGAPFPEALVPGTCQEADVIYWPSAYPQRALIAARRGRLAVLGDVPAAASVESFLHGAAGALGRQPWLERVACLLADVVPIQEDGRWWARDASGAALPLTTGDHWRLLALSGGHPVALAGEWDGEELLPLGVSSEGVYHLLGDGQ